MAKKIEKKPVKKTMKASAPKKASTKKPDKKKVSSKKLSMEDFFNLTCNKAYELFLQRGAGHGDDQSDWFKAESFVRSKYKV
jgi:hypothetical protein